MGEGGGILGRRVGLMKPFKKNGERRLGRDGFTLIELQVSICLLLLMASSSASLLIGYMHQIQWLESRTAIHASCSPDLKRVVFSEIVTGHEPSSVVYQVSLQTLAPSGSDLQAVVCLVRK
jgi:hypothetical protein